MRVLVCGGRNYDDRTKVCEVMDQIHAQRGITLVIAGGARGADTLAEEWATARGVECVVFYAKWDELGRSAGPIRNQQMLDEGRPDLVVAFPGARGTADMTRRAKEAGLEVVEIERAGPDQPLKRGQIIGKRLGGEPKSEAEHYMKCPTCGGYFDMRDLGQVFEHEGPLPHPVQDKPQ